MPTDATEREGAESSRSCVRTRSGTLVSTLRKPFDLLARGLVGAMDLRHSAVTMRTARSFGERLHLQDDVMQSTAGGVECGGVAYIWPSK